MDTMHPAIVQAIAAHEGDSALYVQMAMRAMDVNELCQSFKSNINRLGLALSRAMLDIQEAHQRQSITDEQRDRLKELLNEGLDTDREQPPVFRILYPDFDPPPRAA